MIGDQNGYYVAINYFGVTGITLDKMQMPQMTVKPADDEEKKEQESSLLPTNHTSVIDSDFKRRFLNLIIRSNKKDFSGKDDEKIALLSDDKEIEQLHAGNFNHLLTTLLQQHNEPFVSELKQKEERSKLLFENRE